MDEIRMDVDLRQLEQGFEDLARRSGIDSTGLFALLVGLYEAPGRYYHVLAHVQAVLAWVRRLSVGRILDTRALEWAAWFHDAIYEPGAAGSDEAKSAALAAAELTARGAAPAMVRRVVALIMVTEHHNGILIDEQILTDADLSILGSSRETYVAYAHAVRREYFFVDDTSWKVGRRGVLMTFLEREHIYHAAQFHGREKAARANIEWEIASLT